MSVRLDDTIHRSGNEVRRVNQTLFMKRVPTVGRPGFLKSELGAKRAPLPSGRASPSGRLSTEILWDLIFFIRLYVYVV